jgi:hypothetical protein
VFDTYEEDVNVMKAKFKEGGLELVTEKLAPIPSDIDGAIWFEHIDYRYTSDDLSFSALPGFLAFEKNGSAT